MFFGQSYLYKQLMQQMHYFMIYAYNILHGCCMFQRYYRAIFSELTPYLL